MPILFLSDLHLGANTPLLNRYFAALLTQQVGRLHALYLLGDLFESWIGDDDDTPFSRSIIAQMATFSAKTPLYIMHGNRDFLLGNAFAHASGAHLLADPSPIDYAGQHYLLSHGDMLCSDDVAYQRYRAKIQSPQWRRRLLRLPLWLRRIIARSLRTHSKHSQAARSTPSDVSISAVEALLAVHPNTQLIHGHTHRPARHNHDINEQHCLRWVLPDWYDDYAGGLLLTPSGFSWVRCTTQGELHIGFPPHLLQNRCQR